VLTSYRDLAPGESIALNGACLTVREHGTGWFTVAAVVTTLERTTIGSWSEGRRINLERAMRLGDRLGGHLVQGHVDGVASVTGVHRDRDALRVVLALPDALQLLMVPHGSIAVDGVSLTVNAVPRPDAVELSIIDYTARHTTLGALEEGDAVHVEADVIAKHVQRLFAAHRAPNH
jgi:riboflavin synthase